MVRLLGLAAFIIIARLQESTIATSKHNEIPVCKCNNHTSFCSTRDARTCIGCQHNTQGDYCELCLSGFYGNATLGTADACKKCPCDLLRSDGNCTQGENSHVKCTKCLEGYTGPLCKDCGVNFFYDKKTQSCTKCDCQGNGNPRLKQQCNATNGHCFDCINDRSGRYCERCKPGYYLFHGREVQGVCKKCFCNGNEDPSIKPVCYWSTGTCLSCVNNTSGRQCEFCALGFTGDAILAKNCTKDITQVVTVKISSNRILVLALSLTLVACISILGYLICFCWWRRRTLRSRARFVSVEMRGTSISSSYDIGLIDPVTGEAVHDLDCEHEVDTLRMTNGNLHFESPYDVDISDTDRML